MTSPPDPTAEPSPQERLQERLSKQDVDRLVIEHLPAMLRFARRLTGDAHTAEDVVQQTLCRVLEKWPTCRGAETFRPWMMQMLVNASRDWQRRDRLRRLRPESETRIEEIYNEEIRDHQPHPHEQLEGDELHERIRIVIDRLPDRQREVALLKYGDQEFDVATIAEVLEISTANVHSCLHLARKAIAESIQYKTVKCE